MHDELSCEPVSSSRLAATHRLKQEAASEQTEIKSSRRQLEQELEQSLEFHLHHSQRSTSSRQQQLQQSDFVANSEAIDEESGDKSTKSGEKATVKMEQRPHLQDNNQQQQQQQQQLESNELIEQQVNGSSGGAANEDSQTASVCAGCSGPIRDKFIFSVIDLLWHQDCVQCADCSLKLHERCFTFNGKLYCRHDYWHRFGPKCYACREPINKSELVQRIKGNRVYHLKCFTCSQCNRRLERGEQLHLIDDKQLLCKQDYQQLNSSRPLSRLQQQQQQQQSKSALQNQRNGSIKNGFLQQEASANNNSTSYFTLLSPNQMRDQERAAAKAKRSSLTSLDNMQDKRLDAAGPEPADGQLDEADDDDDDDQNDELMERDLDEPVQQDEVDEEGDDEVEASAHLFAHENMDLENEENRTGSGANPQQQLALEVNGSNNSNNKSTAANCPSAAKRRRRRKRVASRLQEKDPSALVSANRAVGKGQSILNGSGGGGGQSASILASMQQTSGQAAANTNSLKCFSSGSTSSSSSSSASNHSTSSNSQRSSSNQLQIGAGRARASHHSTTTAGQQSHHSAIQRQQQHNNSNSNNEHQSAGAGHKPTRVRTVLNEKQLQTLRDCYAMNPRPDALMKEQLVDMTGLSPRVIRVWFQNKRCKDKKKSILYKQMQQHEKDGRHLAGLTHIRGVPLVASSPIQYHEEHSSTQQHPADSPQQSVHSPPGAQMSTLGNPQQQPAQGSPSSLDIHTYQPPWKSLMDYAQQQQPSQPPTGAKQQAVNAQQPQQPDRLDAASPRYQQLISQMHGYGHTNPAGEPLSEHQVLELQPPSQQQQPAPPTQYSQPAGMMLASHQPSPTAAPAQLGAHYPNAGAVMQPPAHHHLHAHLTQVGGPPAPPASHHLHQFHH